MENPSRTEIPNPETGNQDSNPQKKEVVFTNKRGNKIQVRTQSFSPESQTFAHLVRFKELKQSEKLSKFVEVEQKVNRRPTISNNQPAKMSPELRRTDFGGHFLEPAPQIVPTGSHVLHVFLAESCEGRSPVLLPFYPNFAVVFP